MHCLLRRPGIIWPSLLFPDDDPSTAQPVPSTGQQLAAALAPAFPQPQRQNLATLGQLLDQQPPDAAKLEEFHTLASGLVTSPALAPEDAGQQAAITRDTAAVFGHAAAMSKTPETDAEGIPNPFASLWNGAEEVLRSMSYYEMKNRAGVIGRNGLGPMLGKLAATSAGTRVHLMGHSFGARLVAYSLSGLPQAATGANSPVKTLYLIQGAFSHFAFANPDARHPGQRPGRAVGLRPQRQRPAAVHLQRRGPDGRVVVPGRQHAGVRRCRSRR